MKRNLYSAFIILSVLVLTQACSPANGNKTGHEFMPDMVHSVAYEANVNSYYYYNTWGSEEDYLKYAMPRNPVEGTIARGYAGGANTKSVSAHSNDIYVTANGSVPYYYGDTEAERTRATNEIIANPYPITEAGLAEGKELYDIYCGICHGPKGGGAGYLVRDANPAKGITQGVYPVQPAILTNDTFTLANNGRLYHAIMKGKNLMGSYADKLSYSERWEVIHYIRSLQAKERGLRYNQDVNTLNNVEVPAGTVMMNKIGSNSHSNDHDTHEGSSHDTDDHGGHGDEDEGHSHDAGGDHGEEDNDEHH